MMPKTPTYVSAVLSALKLRHPEPRALQALDDTGWTELLKFTDRMHLTLILGKVCQDSLPAWVRSRVERNQADNCQRFEAIKAMYSEIADRFRDQQVEHLVLKGFAQASSFGRDPRLRFQSDLDLYCPESSLLRARQCLSEMGYTPVKWCEYFPSDQHLNSVMRHGSWEWRDNWFDPEMPLAVEIHFRFWNEESARFDLPGVDQFWPRRTEQQMDGLTFPAMDSVDCLAYACMHALRHIVYGSLVIGHIYEVAWFLHANADNRAFWRRWLELHHPSLRLVQTICFRLAHDWFLCDIPREVDREMLRAPASVQRWFEEYGRSPLYTSFRPNKDGMLLHFSLIPSRDRFAFLSKGLVFRRPRSPKGLLEGQAGLMASRIVYHGRTLLPALKKSVGWWWSTRDLS